MREREQFGQATIAAETMYNLLELIHQQEGLDIDSMMRRLKDLSAYSLTHAEIMEQGEGLYLHLTRMNLYIMSSLTMLH